MKLGNLQYQHILLQFLFFSSAVIESIFVFTLSFFKL